MVHLQITPKQNSCVVEQYCEQKHNKISQTYVQRKISKTICRKIEKIDIDENNDLIFIENNDLIFITIY